MAPRFPLLGEPLVLDLMNTLVRTGRPDQEDLLEEEDAACAWVEAQLHRLGPNAGEVPAPARHLRLLRTDIGNLLRARGDRSEPDAGALGRLNALAGHGAPQLRWAEAGPELTHEVAGDEHPLLVAVAVSAIELLTGPAEAARSCAHPACTLLFHDPTGRRRWCSAATCGNRSRVARHYARRHPQ